MRVPILKFGKKQPDQADLLVAHLLVTHTGRIIKTATGPPAFLPADKRPGGS